MDVSRGRGRGRGGHDPAGRGRPLSRNKQWVAPGSEGERWERGRGRGRGFGRGGHGRFPHNPVRTEEQREQEPVLESLEEREAFFKELAKAREAERKQAIADGLMDDPNVRKRLEDAIVIKGTCQDMCPRFERYRRERENNLMYWEQIPGTKRVDHARAVKMYERAAGDKIIPSDIRPPEVLKRTLDYLFHELLPREGQVPQEPSTLPFIRDRSRAVRNDFVLQHDSGPIAMECHERCARFHILSLHLGKSDTAIEGQQMMNTLQTLKEYYMDQRGVYEFRCELEMRVYHRLANMRDQVDRHDKVPDEIVANPVYSLANRFREHVQKVSGKITKASSLLVDEAGMGIFNDLATVLKSEGNVVMIFLIACILEFVFGKDTIEDIESIRSGLTNSDIVDGYSIYDEDEHMMEDVDDEPQITEVPSPFPLSVPLPASSTQPISAHAPSWPATSVPVEKSAFGNLKSTNAFNGPSFGQPISAFGSPTPPSGFPQTSAFTKAETLAPASQIQDASNPFTGFGAPTSNPFMPASSSIFNTTSAAKKSTPSLSVPSTPIPNFFDKTEPSTSKSETPNLFTSKPPSETTSSFFSTPPATQPNLLGSQTATKSEPIPNFFAPKPSSQLTSIPNFFGNKDNGALSSTVVSTFSVPESAATTPSPFALAASTSSHLDQTQPPPVFSLPTPTPSPIPATSPDPPPPPKLNPFAPTFVPSSQLTPKPPVVPDIPTSNIQSSKVGDPSPSDSNATLPSLPTVTSPPVADSTNKVKPILAGVEGGANPPPSSGTILFSQPGEKPSDPSPAPTPILPAFAPVASKENPLFIDVTPQAPKLEPISLPGTPTVTAPLGNPFASSSSSSIVSPAPAKKKRPPVITATLPEIPPSEVLSPLVLHSPTVSRGSSMRGFNSPSSSFILPQAAETSPPSPSPVNGRVKGKGKGKEKAPSNLSTSVSAADLYGDDDETLDKPISEASQKVDTTLDETELAYRAAVEAADRYSERVEELRSSQSRASPERRKRALSSLDSPTSLNGISFEKKRRKRQSRPSGDYQPRSDEELVKRFTQNHEEHKRRWASGSFLQLIRDNVDRHLKSSTSLGFPPPGTASPSWSIWLSLNPDVHATAIWLERKFDMPVSGRWLDGGVFSIRGNKAAKDTDVDHPGIIVFECTPLEGATDDLERKYRILDDCARLRDLVALFPPKRHFVPALFIVKWTEDGKPGYPDGDVVDMVAKLIAQSTISSYCVFDISSSTNDLDQKFGNALAKLDLDVEGRLVRVLTVRGVFKLLETTFTTFVQEWFEKCTIMGLFGWNLYGRLLQASIELLNSMAGYVQLLIASERIGDCLPLFEPDPQELSDSDSMYDAAFSWLADPRFGLVGDSVTVDLALQRDMGRAFPAQTFVDQLYDLVQHETEHKLDAGPKSKFPVATSDISVVVDQFKSFINSVQSKLNFSWSISVRRSPKRRSLSEATDTTTDSKRRRLSPSVESSPEEPGLSALSTPQINGRDSPSPSNSTISLPQSESSVVTVAMLRALTKNLKQKYGGTNLKSQNSNLAWF